MGIVEPAPVAFTLEFERAVLDALPSGIVVLDEQRRVVWGNRAFEERVGLDAEQIRGLGWGEAVGCATRFGGNEPCGHAECGPCPALALINAALESGRAHRRVSLDIAFDQRVEQATLDLSASKLIHQGSRFAVLVLQSLDALRPVHRPIAPAGGLHGMIGEHPKILAVFDAVREAAETDAPVLIEGESGTGKEMVARALHKQSARAKGLLVPVNCGAIPEGLLESELFGHERGAFTGAVKEHRGRFALADGGTLFLDEIGELNLAMQVKLLRVLEDGAITRVGGDITRHVDVRIICATNRNLEGEVAAGRFRADLFYRLSVLPIAVPPLRERAEDIPLLAEHILDTLAGEGQCSRPRARVSDETMTLLLAHDWPGNIRELENTLRYASLKAHGDAILPAHLPRAVRAAKRATAPDAFAVAQPRLLDRSRVLDALDRAGGNKSEAARLLGVGRATLYRFLSKQR